MTADLPDPMQFAPPSAKALTLYLIDAASFDDWLDLQPVRVRLWLQQTGFRATAGQLALVPDADGGLNCAIAGLGRATDHARERFCLAGTRRKLPPRIFRLEHKLDTDRLTEEALGWLLAGYSYKRFKPTADKAMAALTPPEGVDPKRLEAIAAGEKLARDLINTPASDMGPQELETELASLASSFGADVEATRAEALLQANLPLVHAVGRASSRAPRLLDMRWGSAGPKLTLVGKGVCFDTGGLNLKPGGSMGLMKKDMGGAANVMGLARMIMAQNWPVQLRVLIPAVENAVSGNAMRPGDVLISRKGLSIEINNTDAEGRLVLADALALADEGAPDMIICMATLTGAARVALGPDVAPYFTRDDGLSKLLQQSSEQVRDPVWPLPLYPGYERMIEPAIADLDNAPAGGMAGAITAALFLQRFVSDARRFVHFDIYGHQPQAAPGRTKGGAGQGIRTLFHALPKALGL